MKVFVPGRICLFGEHSDWSGGYRRVNAEIGKGYTIIAGTNQGIRAEVEPHPTQLVVTSTLPDGTVRGPFEVEMSREALLAEAEKGGFFSYIAGVAYQILTHYYVKGLTVNCTDMDLPLRKGLSSSAAICVLAARAFNHAYDLRMTTRGEMEYAYQGELLTPSRCGRMDQGCAYGQRPVLMTFDGDLMHVAEVPIKHPLYFIIVDLHAEKDTVEILAKLNQCYPFPQSDMDRNAHYYLGELNKKIVHEALYAINEGDAEALGQLMTKSQALFDEYLAPICPSELEAPVLHKLLSHQPLEQLVWGGKGVGSQGDGTAQLVARDEESRDQAIEIIERELEMSCLRLDLAPPDRVRKAVIPVAGFGTRLYPASKAVKKEMFPVVDVDGLAKPVIQLIVEEAVAAGIEEICLIVRPEDQKLFEEYFHLQIPIEHYNKLPTELRDYTDYLRDLGRRIRFVVQEKQDGFGHAVYAAREWVGDEPFLLLLGDHLYRSDIDVTCTQQVLDVYEQHQVSVLGLMQTPEELISKFGTVAGEWLAEDGLLSVSEFAEKPTLDYARTKLRVAGIPEGNYLTVFGLYVLKPELFEIIEDHVERNLRQKGEIQLTTALEELRKRDGFQGCVIKGRRFDIGTPEAYVQTIGEFATADPE
ncbi:sugar phosphate nucleotidyltransferase [Candidatus Sumerlaeota bacterium]